MTNTEIIISALKAHGMTDEQLQQLFAEHNGDLPFHTIPEWSRRGYHLKDNEEPLFDCFLWKHTNKPSRAAIEAATEAGEEAPETFPHFYKKLSNIYSFAQVEKDAPAPDLATIKARFGSLPGLTLTVKGEKTGAPNVWFSGDVEKYADEIKAAGGIWSKKKSAYWVKPSAAPAKDKPVTPIPSFLEDAPAPQTAPEPAPVPGPGPWKKCSFYTIRLNETTKRPTVQQMDGYTDGIYNYYAIGQNAKQWYAIHPVYGLSVAYESTRQATQARALELSDEIREFEANADDRAKAYAEMIKAAQESGNLSSC